MTKEQADILYAQVRGLTFKQLALLWRWITLEVGGRIMRKEIMP